MTREGSHTFWTFWGDLEEDHTVVQVGRWERRMPRYLVVFFVGKHMYSCKISIWPSEMYFVVVGTYSWL